MLNSSILAKRTKFEKWRNAACQHGNLVWQQTHDKYATDLEVQSDT